MKHLSPKAVLYLYKSTIQSCIEYCCHVWAQSPCWYLELLHKLQNLICRTVGPSLAASLETLAHHWNVASLSLFHRYYFGRCSSELARLVPLPYSWARFTCYSDRLHNFCVTKMFMLKVSFFTQLNTTGIFCQQNAFLRPLI